MQVYEDEVAYLERRFHAVALPSSPVVFYGSSPIRRWESVRQDLGDPRIVNLGFGGSTLEACAWFFPRLVTPCRPRSVVLYAGDNDIGEGETPQRIMLFLESFLWRFRQGCPDAKLTVLSVKPSPVLWDREPAIRELNARMADLLGLEGAGYIDVHTPMLGEDGRPRWEYYTSDGLHLSREGYQLWTNLLGERRSEIFKR